MKKCTCAVSLVVSAALLGDTAFGAVEMAQSIRLEEERNAVHVNDVDALHDPAAFHKTRHCPAMATSECLSPAGCRMWRHEQPEHCGFRNVPDDSMPTCHAEAEYIRTSHGVPRAPKVSDMRSMLDVSPRRGLAFAANATVRALKIRNADAGNAVATVSMSAENSRGVPDIPGLFVRDSLNAVTNGPWTAFTTGTTLRRELVAGET